MVKSVIAELDQAQARYRVVRFRHKTERGQISSCFAGNTVSNWTWDGVDSMIRLGLAIGRR